jgi:hypothetical protein
MPSETWFVGPWSIHSRSKLRIKIPAEPRIVSYYSQRYGARDNIQMTVFKLHAALLFEGIRVTQFVVVTQDLRHILEIQDFESESSIHITTGETPTHLILREQPLYSVRTVKSPDVAHVETVRAFFDTFFEMLDKALRE